MHYFLQKHSLTIYSRSIFTQVIRTVVMLTRVCKSIRQYASVINFSCLNGNHNRVIYFISGSTSGTENDPENVQLHQNAVSK